VCNWDSNKHFHFLQMPCFRSSCIDERREQESENNSACTSEIRMKPGAITHFRANAYIKAYSNISKRKITHTNDNTVNSNLEQQN
jgi:hypothetical protein